MDTLQDGYRRLRMRGGGVEVRIKEEQEEEEKIMLAVFRTFVHVNNLFGFTVPLIYIEYSHR